MGYGIRHPMGIPKCSYAICQAFFRPISGQFVTNSVTLWVSLGILLWVSLGIMGILLVLGVPFHCTSLPPFGLSTVTSRKNKKSTVTSRNFKIKLCKNQSAVSSRKIRNPRKRTYRHTGIIFRKIGWYTEPKSKKNRGSR